MTDKIALSVTEAAEFLGISRPTMYKLINRADFPADFRVGSRRLIHKEKLMEWVAAQTEARP